MSEEQSSGNGNGGKKKKPVPVITALQNMAPQLSVALAGAIPIDYWIRVLVTTLRKNPKLQLVDYASLQAAVLEAAQARLLLDGVLGHAFLVPFKRGDKQIVQFMPGYRGLMHMARRSGEIAKIQPRVVFENDTFEFEYGTTERCVHLPAPVSTRGPWKAVYAVAWMKEPSAPPQFEVMPKADVYAIRDGSPGYRFARDKNRTVWSTDEIAMALKTGIRKLCKWLPLSIDDERIVQRDEQRDAGAVETTYEEVRKRPLQTLLSTEGAVDDLLQEEEAPPEKEDGAAIATPEQVRALRKVYEACVAETDWNAAMFLPQVAVARLEVPIGQAQTLKDAWAWMADETPAALVVEAIEALQARPPKWTPDLGDGFEVGSQAEADELFSEDAPPNTEGH